jgi:ribosome-binding protein aMBF1 (putative translation factor)
MYQSWYRPAGSTPGDSRFVSSRRSPALASQRREALAERVRDLRVARGWSQEQLAARAGLDRKTVNRLENATYSPAADRLFVLADALGVAASELLAGIS